MCSKHAPEVCCGGGEIMSEVGWDGMNRRKYHFRLHRMRLTKIGEQPVEELRRWFFVRGRERG